jgi:hypothetical protein
VFRTFPVSTQEPTRGVDGQRRFAPSAEGVFWCVSPAPGGCDLTLYNPLPHALSPLLARVSGASSPVSHLLAHAPSAPVRTAITLSIVAVAYLPYEWERTIVTGKSRFRSLRPAAGRALAPRCCAFAHTRAPPWRQTAESVSGSISDECSPALFKTVFRDQFAKWGWV